MRLNMIMKSVAIGFLLFLGLWIAGTIRSFTLPYPPPMPVLSLPASRTYDNSLNAVSNVRQIGLLDTPLPLVLENPNVDQIRVREKRAEITSATNAFDDDGKRVRDAIKTHQAEIFNEDNNGIEPNRRLFLTIGVKPDQFDGLVEELRTVGRLALINVEQKDRTDEFRRLRAQRQSLAKYLEAISKLRDGKNTSLDEALRLEQKVREIETELQGLSVQLGDLLGKQPYYQVHLTLVEYQPGSRHDKTYTVWQRVADGFAWAIVYWFAVALLVGLLVGVWISVRILQKK